MSRTRENDPEQSRDTEIPRAGLPWDRRAHVKGIQTRSSVKSRIHTRHYSFPFKDNPNESIYEVSFLPASRLWDLASLRSGALTGGFVAFNSESPLASERRARIPTCDSASSTNPLPEVSSYYGYAVNPSNFEPWLGLLSETVKSMPRLWKV